MRFKTDACKPGRVRTSTCFSSGTVGRIVMKCGSDVMLLDDTSTAFFSSPTINNNSVAVPNKA
jgi:hypothetical protein